jgi:hypothetical protein
MAVPYQPQNLDIQQSDGNILLTWSASLSATDYTIQRSIDGATFATIGTTGNVIPQYLDVLPGTGTMYWYQVIAVNGSGNSTASSIVKMVAAPPSEMSLFELRLRSQQRADRVNSQFVVDSEWNFFIKEAMYELYDLLITSYEDYNVAPYVYINTDGTSTQYALPNGVTNYKGGVYAAPSGTPAAAFYKLSGVDLGVNTSNNAWVTINKYDYIDRNKYVYPNSTSTIYGVFNMRYRIMGNNINFIPAPSGSQQIRLTYQPRLAGMLADTDLTTIGYSGWLQYVIVRAAKYALDKEEGTDTGKLDQELAFLKLRIEQAAQNRDVGQADTISETRKDSVYGGNGWGMGGGGGGW